MPHQPKSMLMYVRAKPVARALTTMTSVTETGRELSRALSALVASVGSHDVPYLTRGTLEFLCHLMDAEVVLGADDELQILV